MKRPKISELPAWRQYLGKLIKVPAERQRAASALGVSEYTLTRWATTEIEPRPTLLQKLPSVFPSHESRLAELIKATYDPSRANPTDLLKAIPQEFLARVLAVLATTTRTLVTSAICNLVLRQALEHLDPDCLGMEIAVVPCTPPVSSLPEVIGKEVEGENDVAQCTPSVSSLPVRSLFEWIGATTRPWTIRRRLLFLGAESLCGYVVEKGEPEIVQNTDLEQDLLPMRPNPYEKSVAVYPLLRWGRIAGCFRVSSSQHDFFTPGCTDLVEQYANLLALAYPEEQFYRPSAISLEVMPPTSQQTVYIATFRQRVLEYRRTSHLSETEAEVHVVQEIEQALLQDTIHSKMSDENASVQRILL